MVLPNLNNKKPSLVPVLILINSLCLYLKARSCPFYFIYIYNQIIQSLAWWMISSFGLSSVLERNWTVVILAKTVVGLVDFTSNL